MQHIYLTLIYNPDHLVYFDKETPLNLKQESKRGMSFAWVSGPFKIFCAVVPSFVSVSDLPVGEDFGGYKLSLPPQRRLPQSFCGVIRRHLIVWNTSNCPASLVKVLQENH